MSQRRRRHAGSIENTVIDGTIREDTMKRKGTIMAKSVIEVKAVIGARAGITTRGKGKMGKDVIGARVDMVEARVGNVMERRVDTGMGENVDIDHDRDDFERRKRAKKQSEL